MADYVRYHYTRFDFASVPSRKTIRSRFIEMPGFVRWLLPYTVREVSQIDECIYLRIGFIDKSIFKALGGIWHKKYKPVASVTTTSICDKSQISFLVNGLLLLIGNAGYRTICFLQSLWKRLEILLFTHRPFVTTSKAKQWYNHWVGQEGAKLLYPQRKPDVELAFALIKQLFGLTGSAQLPYRGLAKVQAFLPVCVATMQLIMVFNWIFNNIFGDTKQFKAYLL